jgi:hypothetical protein
MGQTILAGHNYRLCVGANPTDPTKKTHQGDDRKWHNNLLETTTLTN